MNQENDTLSALQDIRSMMQKSSRFISLSGLSGVFSGSFALLGALAAWWRTHSVEWIHRSSDTLFGNGHILNYDQAVVWFLLLDAMLVLLGSVLASFYFTRKKAQRKNQPLWGPYSRQLIINFMIPLVSGAVFCAILFMHGLIGLIAPATLVFYGLALTSAGRYVTGEVTYLGYTEILLGLISLYFTGQGLIFWAIGFGVMHILYGTLMYFRHDK